MPQPPNFNKMLKQVQQMQTEMAKAQEALKDEVVEASAGGGMVTVKVTGDLEVKEIRINPDAVDPEDVELLSDMVLAAVNEALRQAVELQAKAMEGAGGAADFDPMAALDALGLGGGGGGGGGLGGLGGPGGGLPGGAPMNRAQRRAKKR
jgi:nucleoid-associated protein EbfC